jgi:hypothetical protein
MISAKELKEKADKFNEEKNKDILLKSNLLCEKLLQKSLLKAENGFYMEEFDLSDEKDSKIIYQTLNTLFDLGYKHKITHFIPCEKNCEDCIEYKDCENMKILHVLIYWN